MHRPPVSSYQNGTVEISIQKKKGQYAICSEIFIFEYEKAHEKGASQTDGKNTFYKGKYFLTVGPNPFNLYTNISLIIKGKEHVSLKVYDATGRVCKTIINKELDTGIYSYKFIGKINGKELSNGVYFAVLNVGNEKYVEKILKIK